jgi:PKD repeat protein
VTITVRDVTPPVADAGPNRIVAEDLAVNFDGSASSDNVGVVNYTWTFNDGGPQTLYGVSPAHTFARPGSYTVTLTVRDAAGNSATGAMTVLVNDVTPPTASAGLDRTVNEDTIVMLDGGASSDNVAVVNYTWTFVDGTPRTLYGMLPTHTFANPGSHTVTLTVRDAAGNANSDTMTVTVLDVTPPTADAGADASGVEGTDVSFDGTASTDNVGIDNYTWDFGDGATAYGSTATHRFASAGVHTVTLTVRDAAGNQDADTLSVTIVPRQSEGPGVLVWAVIALIVVAVITATLLLLRRRKSPPQEIEE